MDLIALFETVISVLIVPLYVIGLVGTIAVVLLLLERKIARR